MKCIFTEKQLSYYFDNECDDKTRDKITAHIKNCEKCKNQLNYYYIIRKELKQTSGLEPSSKYMNSFIEKLTRISSGHGGKGKIIPLFKKPFFRFSTVAAALLLLFIGTRFLTKSQDQIKYNPLITYLKGTVFIAGETTSPRLALVSDKILKGQTIATGPHSKIDIELKKAFKFTLKENTVLSIEELSDKQNRITVICQLKRGGVLADVEKRGNPSNIKVITALADISVKGTRFLVEASPKSKGGNVEVSVLRGKVEVVHKNIPDNINNIYMLTENEKISFQPEKTTAFKTELTEQDIEKFWEIYDIGHRDFEIKYQQPAPSAKTNFKNADSLK